MWVYVLCSYTTHKHRRNWTIIQQTHSQHHHYTTTITTTTITTTTGSIVLALGHLRAIINNNEIIFFPFPNSNSSVSSTATTITTSSGNGSGSGFQIHALNTIFSESLGVFERRLRLLSPLVDTLLVETDSEQDAFEGAQKLLPLQDTLQSFDLELNETRCVCCC